MILPELLDVSQCVLLQSTTGGAHALSAADTAHAQYSQLYNYTLFPTVAASTSGPRLLYGYTTCPVTTLASSTLSNSLSNGLASSLTQTLPHSLALSHQQHASHIHAASVAAGNLQASLTGSLNSNQNGVLGASALPLLQAGYQGNVLAALLAQGKLPSTMLHSYRTVGYGTPSFQYRAGMKRKADDGDGRNSVESASSGETTKKDTLSDLMQPLYCKLCKVILNAPAQAKQHYEGKNHARKLKMYMDGQEEADDAANNNSQEQQVSSTTSSSSSESAPPGSPNRTSDRSALSPAATSSTTGSCGEPACTIPAANGTTKPDSDATTDKTGQGVKTSTGVAGAVTGAVSKASPSVEAIDPEIYCKICSVSFNSIKQSRQHYNGKNHAKRARAIKSEANGGHKKGTHFHKKYGPNSCHTCRLQFTSQQELEAHCTLLGHVPHRTREQFHNGLRLSSHHQYVLDTTALAQAQWAATAAAQGCILGLNSGKYNLSSMHLHGSQFNTNHTSYRTNRQPGSSSDFSNYRLPSNQFYCSVCNRTINSEPQMAKHIDSDRHKELVTALRTEQEAAIIARNDHS